MSNGCSIFRAKNCFAILLGIENKTFIHDCIIKKVSPFLAYSKKIIFLSKRKKMKANNGMD